MNWQTVSDTWDACKARIAARWDKLDSAELDRIDADRDRLVESLVRFYGVERDQAEQQVSDWEQEEDEALACAGDKVEVAGADSFPASDPPGWIRQAPRSPKQSRPPPRSGAQIPDAARQQASTKKPN